MRKKKGKKMSSVSELLSRKLKELAVDSDRAGTHSGVLIGDHAWYGSVSNRQSDDPARLLIYSLTKTYTAITILRLAERKSLSLDHKLSRWYPLLPEASAITVRQLLNHTSGVPDYCSLPAYHHAVKMTPGEPWTTEQFIERAVAGGLSFHPGTSWAYSNTGYTLLRLIIVRRSTQGDSTST